MSNFYETKLSNAEKNLNKALLKLSDMSIFLHDKNRHEFIKASFEYNKICELLANESRLIPVHDGRTVELNQQIQDIHNMNISIEDEIMVHIKTTSVLPKKESGNPTFFRSSLHYLCRSFSEKNSFSIDGDQKAIVVFKYNFSRESRELRDYDNIELNAIMDTITLFFLSDDNPKQCDKFEFSAPSTIDNTEIFLMPKSYFETFLINHYK